jgi:hypothetical protein
MILTCDTVCARTCYLDFHILHALARKGLVLARIKPGQTKLVAATPTVSTAKRAIRNNGGSFYVVNVRGSNALGTPSDTRLIRCRGDQRTVWVLPPGRVFQQGISGEKTCRGHQPEAKIPGIKSVFDKPQDFTCGSRHCSHTLSSTWGSHLVYRQSLPPTESLEIQEVKQPLSNHGNCCLMASLSPPRVRMGSPICLYPQKTIMDHACASTHEHSTNKTIPQRTPLPRQDSSTVSAGAKWFSAVDLQTGYHQIRME